MMMFFLSNRFLHVLYSSNHLVTISISYSLLTCNVIIVVQYYLDYLHVLLNGSAR